MLIGEALLAPTPIYGYSAAKPWAVQQLLKKINGNIELEPAMSQRVPASSGPSLVLSRRAMLC